jgi:alpha-L-rhamnosidase
MNNLLPKTRHWKGHWIWPVGAEGSANIYGLFRKEITLEKEEKLTLFISADMRYRLYLDGYEKGEGPLKSQTFNMYYDVYNFFLAAGKHCLAAEVYCLGEVDSKIPVREGKPRGGFLMEVLDSSGETVLTTDSSWRSILSPAWQRETQRFPMNKVNAFQEFFDARMIPTDGKNRDWRLTGFDDSRWTDSIIIPGRTGLHPPQAGPWSLLQERDIPFMEQTPLHPVKIIKVEECISLANRQRAEDVTIRLSMPGKPVTYSTVKGEENLCTSEGRTLLNCSTRHLEDKNFDGFYDPVLTVDFGKQYTAYLELELEGPAGTLIEFGFSERLIDGYFNNTLEGWFGGKYTLKGQGRETFKTFNWIGFRFLRLRVTDCFENLTIHSCRAINSTYPYGEIKVFSSESDRLNNIFAMCRHTIRLCSNEFLMDTPWREQGQWLGDVAAVTLGGIYACFGDLKLPEKFLRQSAATQLPTGLLANMTNHTDMNWEWVIPDYTLWWVWALWNHYEYTGNEEWIHRFYPHVLKILQYFSQYLDETGLLYRVPAWNLIDWAPLDREGYSAGMSAIYHAALEAMEKMAQLRKDDYYLTLIGEQKKGIEKAFSPTFYDDEQGVCVDCVEDGVKSRVISEHTNSLALMQNLVFNEQKESIISKVFDRGSSEIVEAQPYFCTFTLIALKKEKRMDLAMKILLDRWGGRMADLGNTSCHEEWGRNGSWRNGKYSGFMRTLSHAWSAYPAQFLVHELTGFAIKEPGCGKVSLNPADIGEDYTVNIPTPRGVISVKMREGKSEVILPEGVELLS